MFGRREAPQYYHDSEGADALSKGQRAGSIAAFAAVASAPCVPSNPPGTIEWE